MKDYCIGIWKDRYILWSLVNKDLRLKYRRSVLGVAWAILTPLGLVLIIGSVYSIIFGVNPKVFIPALFAGLNPWLFINIAADGGAMSFIGAEGYLKQTTVNAQIFPIRVVLGGFINLLYCILAFFAVYLFLQPQLFGPKMLMMFPGLIIMFVFSLSIANIAAVLNLKARDYQPLQNLILQGLFYITPIIYEPTMLEKKGFSIVYQLNPVYYIIEVVRTPMLGRTLPTWNIYAAAIGITVLLFIFGANLAMKIKTEIAFRL